MTTGSKPTTAIVYLPGAGGGMPDLGVFRARPHDRVERIDYPTWREYEGKEFVADKFISGIAECITAKIPDGPIRIVGDSIGGQFGYAAAFKLLESGREVAGLCAIDSFMDMSDQPSADWKSRALKQGMDILKERRFTDFALFLRSKFWRAGLRFAPSITNKLGAVTQGSAAATVDPIFEAELNIRFILRETAPYLAALARETVPLSVPSVLLRTRRTAKDDQAWRDRCPDIRIFEIPGEHYSIFDQINIAAFHETFVAATLDWRGVE